MWLGGSQTMHLRVAPALCCDVFFFLCCHAFLSGRHRCQPFNFFQPSSGRIGIGVNSGSGSNNIPISSTTRSNRRSSNRRSSNRRRRRSRRSQRPPPPPPVALVAAALGAAVATVQVQYHLHLCTNKSTEWVAVQARFHSPGLAWQTKAGVTSRRTLGRVEKFGVLPTRLPHASAAVGCKGKDFWSVFVFGGK